MYDCLVAAAGRTVPEGEWRHEVVDVARQAAPRTGALGRISELGSVVAFGMRLRAMGTSARRPPAVWGQGALLGALVLLGAASVQQVSDVAGGQASVGNLVVMAALVGTSVAVVGGRGRAAVVLGVTGLVAAIATQQGGLADDTTSLTAVGVAALAVGTASTDRVHVPGGRTCLAVSGAAGLAAVVVGGTSVAVAATGVATLALPIGLLIAGTVDPRLAAAAVVTWAWRFVALDPSEVADAAVALGRGERVDVVLLRLALMTWALVTAVVVARRSVRRAAAL